MQDIKYTLEKYRYGGSNRYTCPQCGGRKCFTRYVNEETGEYLAEECGKCNHEQRCGYHYKPSDYFREHPSFIPKPYPLHPKPHSFTPKPSPPSFIPEDYVHRSHSKASTFMQWLMDTLKDKEAVERVYEDYKVGATKDGGVIFWQIDSRQQVRTGKVMYYKSDGHRTESLNWIHAILKKRAILPEEWTLGQCLFGEHLLTRYPDKEVRLVESEKTALVCACRYPEFLWVATGGCSNLNPRVLQPYMNRHIVVIPDSGMYTKWQKILQFSGHKLYTISNQLEKYTPNTDLADILTGEARLLPEFSHMESTPQEQQLEQMKQQNSTFQSLVDKLELQIV